ncbi:MAG: MOSC domain-containing protein [Planctomycetota bacterium]
MSEAIHLTEIEIEAGLQEVRKSPSNNGLLEAIVVRPGLEERRFLQQCRLSPEGGTEGDAWDRGCWLKLPDGRPDPDVQICITNSRMINLVAGEKQRWELAGDNLFVDLDLSRENLTAGQLLSIGESVIQITEQAHNGCAKFSKRFGSSALKVVNSPPGQELRLRGIYAKVIKAGLVEVGDLITKL